MRKKVAEGRQKEFAAFGFDGDIPNPEERATFESSKLKWDEQKLGKHAEMLDWVKSLIKLRRSHVCFNDGDMHQLRVSSDEGTRTLVMQREEARVLINLGNAPRTFAMLKGEKKSIASREGLNEENGQLELPPMTLAVLLSPSEEVENRLVARRK